MTDSCFTTTDDLCSLCFAEADDLCDLCDLCFATAEDLCFITAEDLCFAMTDEVENTHNEPDTANKQSATVIRELRGMTGSSAADHAFTPRF
jgi:hypothetical protein